MGFTNTISAIRAARTKHRAYRRTYDELSSLTDRELNDLGIGRSQIGEVARSAAYGNDG